MISLNKILLLNEKNLENIHSREDLISLSQFAESFVVFCQNNVKAYDLINFGEIEKIVDDFSKIFNLSLDFLIQTKNIGEDDKILKCEKNKIDKEIELPLSNLIGEFQNDNIDHYYKVFIINILISDYVKEKIILPEKRELVFAIKNIEQITFSNLGNRFNY